MTPYIQGTKLARGTSSVVSRMCRRTRRSCFNPSHAGGGRKPLVRFRAAHRREHASVQTTPSCAQRMTRGHVPTPMKESISNSPAWSILSASGADVIYR